MLITKLEKSSKNQIRVSLDYEYAFWLYENEIRRLSMEEGQEISADVVQKLLEEVVLPRAKEKAVLLLKYSDRTCLELRTRLQQNGYTDTIIDQVLAYTQEYGYVDDERYADIYVRLRSAGKSRCQIEMELVRKGIEKEQIRRIMEENEFDEEDSLRKLVKKRLRGRIPLSPQERKKQLGYFARRGYGFSLIQQVMREYEQEEENQ